MGHRSESINPGNSTSSTMTTGRVGCSRIFLFIRQSSSRLAKSCRRLQFMPAKTNLRAMISKVLFSIDRNSMVEELDHLWMVSVVVIPHIIVFLIEKRQSNVRLFGWKVKPTGNFVVLTNQLLNTRITGYKVIDKPS